MLVIGIDPGLDGGIAYIDVLSSGVINYYAEPMPVKGKKDVDLPDVFDIDSPYRPQLVCVELQGARPGQGPAGTFTTGKNYGRLLGGFEMLQVPIQIVTAGKWQRAILGKSSKDKTRAINYVRTRWPEVDLKPGSKRTYHDGVADAMCIAEYALKSYRGEL